MNLRRKPPSPRRSITTGALLALAFFLLTAVPSIAGMYIDFRWFRSLGFVSVFLTQLQTQAVLGLVVGFAVLACLGLNIALSERLTRGTPTLRIRDADGVPRIDLGAFVPRLLRGAAALAACTIGVAAAEHWDIWLCFQNAVSFGTTDPIFGRDVAFYIFTLPLLGGVRTLVFWTLALSFGACAATYAIRGSVSPEGKIQPTREARIHLSVLGAVGFLLLAFDAWLSTAELLYSDLGPVGGASYADVHAALPMRNAQMGVSLLGAFLVALSTIRQKNSLLMVAVGLYAVVGLVLVRAYPSAVHRFSVLPNEGAKEAPFIQHNIEATRAAYGLENVKERELSGEVGLTIEDIEANRATIDNIRVWDHAPLLDTFGAIQEIRTYYEFQSVDNDRYRIDGELRQTMLSPRELYAENLPNASWINRHFTFTHGYGVTLGPVNVATNEGLPVLQVKDIPPESSIPEISVSRPEIYFGELSNEYVFVKTATDEFDYPSGDDNVYAAYEGNAGIRLDSALTVAALAIKLSSMKLLLSEDIDEESRVLLYRNIRQRVTRIAPFLVYDRDPYMVVRENGRLVWIQDAYTVSSRYPYSELSREGINYIRNSVKVTIDAYDGDLTFYVNDEADPLLATWAKIFPELFSDMENMPRDLREHLRYPEDLFRVQTDMFTVYHMDSAQLVYSREDQWEVPTITSGDSAQRLQPYFTVMKLPGEASEEYIQMLPFTPKHRENLSAWMVARMDGARLGELVVYRFPKRSLIFGPAQIMNRINQDADVSRQISLWDQRGSSVDLGTLLVIPIEESLVYVVPLYLRSSGGRIPELKRVIAVYENRIAMEPTLDAAIRSIVSGSQGEAPVGDDARSIDEVSPETTVRSNNAETNTALQLRNFAGPGANRLQAKALFDQATAAQRRGDWGGYGEALKALGAVLTELASQPERNLDQSISGTSPDDASSGY
ncbi:MAG: UPF0182 family protein [Myxococcota bacterium]